jgi:hypothetical protein
MTPEQEEHLKWVEEFFTERVEPKYRQGQLEHGGDLWKKDGLIDMAIEEAIDLMVYLPTLKEQLKLRGNGAGRKVICVDLDGTLCYGESWTPENVMIAEPKQEIIDKINILYEKNFIVIYTARRDDLIPATLEWLRRNNVRYHAFSNQKIGADQYIDDKVIRESEVK